MPALDEWLRRRAQANEGRFSRTYVVATAERRVIGFYALAGGAVARDEAPRNLGRNAPTMVPVMILGRLAVDHRFERRGLGADMLRDALLRSLQVAEIGGFAALLVHAISPEAAEWYRERGFRASPVSDLILMLPLAEVARNLG